MCWCKPHTVFFFLGRSNNFSNLLSCGRWISHISEVQPVCSKFHQRIQLLALPVSDPLSPCSSCWWSLQTVVLLVSSQTSTPPPLLRPLLPLNSVNPRVPVACHVTVFHSGCLFMHVITNRPVGPLRHSAFLPGLRLHFPSPPLESCP